MLHIKNLNDGLELFKTLGSDVRMRIVELLSERGEMNMNEIATATRYNIPIIEVVFNNHALGMVRQWQTLFYGKRYSQTILEDKVDYCKVSEAMGAKAIRVTKKEEIDDAIKTALSAEVPVVIEVVINQDDKVWPMVAPGAAIEDSFDEKDQENRIQN